MTFKRPAIRTIPYVAKRYIPNKVAEALEARLEIRLVPVCYVEDDDYIALSSQ